MQTRFLSVWEAPRARETYVGFHSHGFYELVYYPAGGGVTALGERAYPFAAHTYALIPPSVSHDERHEADGAVICLLFDTDESLTAGMRKDTLLAVHRLLREMLDEAQRQAYGYEALLEAKLTELCVLLSREERRPAAEKDLGHVVNYLRENYHERILLSDLAARMHLSYDYFQHKFKSETGVSPQKFLLHRRLEAARALLDEGGLSCTEIAYRTGFSTSAQLSALFKREYGVSPLVYRKKRKS